MLELYYGCLIGGILFAVLAVILGDFLELGGPDFIDPLVLVSLITAFGGAGVLLASYASLSLAAELLLAISSGVILSFLVFFFYVKPMKKAENSTGYSVKELEGKLCEVSVAIPAQGFGEVLVKVGAAYTNQIAASFDRAELATGSTAVVVEVKEDVLYVSRYDELD